MPRWRWWRRGARVGCAEHAEWVRSGTATLADHLFLDAAGGTVWGDGSAGTRAWGPTSLAPHHNHTIPVFGVVPARQDVAVGSYTDSVAVTIVF